MKNIESTQETKKELMVFDLYGTLLELPSKGIKTKLINTIQRFFKQEEIEKIKQVQKAELIQEIGMDKNEIEQKCGIKLTDSQFNKLKKQTEEDIIGVQLYPDVIETLKYLKSKGYKIALISNLGKPYEEPLRKLLDGMFDYEILSCKEGVKKPNFKIFEKLHNISGYEFKDMIMVGDTLHSDVLGAKNAGMLPIFLNLSSKKMELIKYDKKDEDSPELIQIHKLSDLKELF